MIDTRGLFVQIAEFAAEPTEPSLSWHCSNASWSELKAPDDGIVFVQLVICSSGSALMLLPDGNSNRAFLYGDL